MAVRRCGIACMSHPAHSAACCSEGQAMRARASPTSATRRWQYFADANQLHPPAPTPNLLIQKSEGGAARYNSESQWQCSMPHCNLMASWQLAAAKPKQGVRWFRLRNIRSESGLARGTEESNCHRQKLGSILGRPTRHDTQLLTPVPTSMLLEQRRTPPASHIRQSPPALQPRYPSTHPPSAWLSCDR